MSPIAGRQIDPPVERVGRVAGDVVGLRHVHDLARICDVAGEARHVQRQSLDLETLLHVVVAEPSVGDLVLDDGEAQMAAFTQEERRRFRSREPARLGHDALEHGGELTLAADRDAELQKIFDHLRPVVGQGRGHEPRELQSSRSRTRYVHDRRMSSTRNARHGSGGNG